MATKTKTSTPRHPAVVRPAAGHGVVRVVAPNEVDVEFMSGVVAQVRRRRTLLGRVGLRIAQAGPQLRRCTLLLVLLGALGLFGAVGTSDSAQAWIWDDWCEYKRISWDADDPRDSLIPYGAPYGATEAEDRATPSADGSSREWAKTSWAQYGTAGLKWDTFFLQCNDFGDWIWNGVADLMFSIPVMLGGMMITLFQWVFQGTIISIFVEPQLDGGVAILDSVIEAMHVNLFMNFVALAVIIAAVVLAWRAIIQGNGLADFLSKFLIMVLIAGFAAWFAAPGNASWVVKGLTGAAVGITGETFAAFSKVVCQIGKGGQSGGCSGEGKGSNVACADSSGEVVQARPVDCIGEVLSQGLLVGPWKSGLAGTPEPQPVPGKKLSQKEWNDQVNQIAEFSQAVRRFQAFTREEVAKFSDDDEGLYGKLSDEGVLTGSKREKEFEKLATVIFDRGKLDAWIEDKGVPSEAKSLLAKMVYIGAYAENETDAAVSTELAEAVKPEYRAVFLNYQGKNASNRFITAIMALVAVIAFGLVLLAATLAYLVLQVALVVLVLLLPIAALIGLIPNYGTRALMNYVMLIFRNLLALPGLGIAIGLGTTMYSAVMVLPLQWYAKMASLLAIALVFLVYRKKLMELAGVGGVNNALSMAGKTAAGTAKFGGKAGFNTLRGVGLAKAGMKAYLNQSKDQRDKHGRRVGGLRRGIGAVWAGAKGAGTGMASEGPYRYKKMAAQGSGGAHARSNADRRGYKTDTAATERRRQSREAAQSYADQRATEQDNMTRGQRVRSRIPFSGSRREAARVNRAAKKGRLAQSQHTETDPTTGRREERVSYGRRDRRGSEGRVITDTFVSDPSSRRDAPGLPPRDTQRARHGRRDRRRQGKIDFDA